MTKVQLRNLTVLSAPTPSVEAEEMLDSEVQASSSYLEEVLVDSLPESVDFEVWNSDYLQSQGVKPVQAGRLLAPATASHKVEKVIVKYKGDSGQWLTLKQERIFLDDGEESPQITVYHPIWEEEVDGRSVVFFTHSVQASDQPSGHINIYHCWWQEGDFLVRLQGPDTWVSIEEMKKIVSSGQILQSMQVENSTYLPLVAN